MSILFSRTNLERKKRRKDSEQINEMRGREIQRKKEDIKKELSL
jgi:hypothetical protein